MTERHSNRCPACGKYVPADADGYYDYAERCELDANGECLGMYIAAFCNKAEADKFHSRSN